VPVEVPVEVPVGVPVEVEVTLVGVSLVVAVVGFAEGLGRLDCVHAAHVIDVVRT
jgi:hypothetical protein